MDKAARLALAFLKRRGRFIGRHIERDRIAKKLEIINRLEGVSC